MTNRMKNIGVILCAGVVLSIAVAAVAPARAECKKNYCFGVNWAKVSIEQIEDRVKADARTKGHHITPMHYAAGYSKSPEVIKTLAEKGGDVTFKSKVGRTPLHWAANRNKNPDIIRVLIDLGADVNAPDKDGTTPLFYAISNNKNIEVIRTLVDLGAKIDVTDARGHTPLLYAKRRDYKTGSSIVEILEAPKPEEESEESQEQ